MVSDSINSQAGTRFHAPLATIPSNSFVLFARITKHSNYSTAWAPNRCEPVIFTLPLSRSGEYVLAGGWWSRCSFIYITSLALWPMFLSHLIVTIVLLTSLSACSSEQPYHIEYCINHRTPLFIGHLRIIGPQCLVYLQLTARARRVTCRKFVPSGTSIRVILPQMRMRNRSKHVGGVIVHNCCGLATAVRHRTGVFSCSIIVWRFSRYITLSPLSL